MTFIRIYKLLPVSAFVFQELSSSSSITKSMTQLDHFTDAV